MLELASDVQIDNSVLLKGCNSSVQRMDITLDKNDLFSFKLHRLDTLHGDVNNLWILLCHKGIQIVIHRSLNKPGSEVIVMYMLLVLN